MGNTTTISWTGATWGIVHGCSRKSSGCQNCFAERIAARFSDKGQAFHGFADRSRAGSKWTGEVALVRSHLSDPLRWRKPRRIFTTSMSDIFHEKLSNEDIAAIFGVMGAARQHTFQVLTKRAERMREWFKWVSEVSRSTTTYDCTLFNHLASKAGAEGKAWVSHCRETEDTHGVWPLPNVWNGVSVENQDTANERIPDLLATPAAVRFLSCEPLIGAIDLTRIPAFGPRAPSALEAAVGVGLDRPAIDWVIGGCESGHGARGCELDWLRSLRDQCADARVSFFLKQAELVPTEVGHGPLVTIGAGSKAKGRGGNGHPIIELPYLDGIQHAAFPMGAS